MTEEGFPATADAMLITNGGSEALYIALQTLLEKGQRIVVAGPTAPNVIEMIRFIGAEPVWATRRGRVSSQDADAIEAVDASAVLLASPSPVTGLALSSDELEAIFANAVRPRHDGLPRPLAGDRPLRPGPGPLRQPRAGRQGRHHRLVLDRPRAGRLARRLADGPAGPDEGAARAEAGHVDLHHRGLPVRRPRRPRRARPTGWPRAATSSRAAATTPSRVSSGSGLVPSCPDAFPALLVDVRAVDDDDRRFAARCGTRPGSSCSQDRFTDRRPPGFVRLDLGAPAAALRTGSHGSPPSPGRNAHHDRNHPPRATVNIFEMMDRARSRQDTISMGLGDPDLATPAHIVAAAKEAIAEGRTGPAHVRGLPELRQAIARKLARDNGVDSGPRDRDSRHHRRAGGALPRHPGADRPGRRGHHARPPLHLLRLHHRAGRGAHRARADPRGGRLRSRPGRGREAHHRRKARSSSSSPPTTPPPASSPRPTSGAWRRSPKSTT